MSEAQTLRLEDLHPLAISVLEKLKTRDMMMATAESCTGGLICGVMTEIAGSSAVVDRGFVTYTNEAKSDMLGVPSELIDRVGAVSKEVAIAMAEGALARSNAVIAVSVTGIAGPGGGTPTKPVGTVHVAVAQVKKSTIHNAYCFPDNGRQFIRFETVKNALTTIINTT